MGNYAEKMQKAAEGVLQPGENVVAAIRTQPRGSTTGMAVGGLVGAAIATRGASKANAGLAPGSMASTWPTGRFAVGLTPQRVVTFNYTAMGKPKQMTSEFSLNDIASVQLDKRKISNGVVFGFVDGSTAEVECAKLEKVDEFVAAFQQVKAQSA
ncbi:MAG TPA: hypothetical protein VFK89_08835 [Actinomycetota bacterium]|nr:hypothetical protein [Actinomycetota bacterium]